LFSDVRACLRPSAIMDKAVLGLSWPLSEQSRHFELGHVLNCAVADLIVPQQIGALATHHAGLWECNLADSSLIWSGGVYDLFGLERRGRITRDQALAHYSEDSRAKLERLRAHAIRHGFGFTIDVEIQSAAVGQFRRVRIVGVPMYDGTVPVRLHGLKLIA
jgi:hypothetical protein